MILGVCRLNKALYSFKQALSAWFEIFYYDLFVVFVFSSDDLALFIKNTNANRIILSLYIDNMIIIGDDISVLKTKLDSLK